MKELTLDELNRLILEINRRLAELHKVVVKQPDMRPIGWGKK